MGSPVDQRNIVDIPSKYWPNIEDLPGELPLIASAVEEHLPGNGVRVALILAQSYPGTPIYLHNVNKIILNYTKAKIRDEYDQGGVTAKELGIKYRMSLGHVEKILASPTPESGN